jgi:hypothetical protein
MIYKRFKILILRMDFEKAANYLFLFGAIVWIVTAFKTKRTVQREQSFNRKLYSILFLVST